MRRGLAAVVVGAALALAAGLAWWALGSRDDAIPAGDEMPAASSDADAQDRRSRETLAAQGSRSSADAASGAVVVGFVRRRGKPAAARVELRGQERWTYSQVPRLDRSLTRLAPRRDLDASAASGADGRFEVSVPRDGAYRIVATASDGATGEAFADVRSAGARALVTIDIVATRPLRGRAVHVDGRPFRGLVVAQAWGPSRVAGAEDAVPTDEHGRFVVEGLAPARCTARFLVPGEVAYFVSEVPADREQEWLVVVDRGVGPLDGLVVDDATEAPIASASVVAATWSGFGGVTSEASAGADGRFSLPCLRDSPTRVTVGADGYALRDYEWPLPSPFVARLVRGATVAGTVRHVADGTVVASAQVSVVRISPNAGMPVLGETTTGVDGRYEVGGLPPGDVFVAAMAPGLAMRTPVDAARSGWSDGAASLDVGARVTIDVGLVAGVSIRGRVLEADGTPVAGASVGVSPAEGPWRAMLDSPASPPRVATSADGSFVVDGLSPDLRVDVRAMAPDGRWTSYRTRATAAPSAPIQLRLGAMRDVAVRAVDAKTEGPVADALVTTASTPRVRARTDEDGRATVRVPESETATSIEVVAAGYLPANRNAGKDEAAVEARLLRSLSVSGRVERADGAPASAAFVMGSGKGSGPVFGLTAADGTFSLSGFDDVDVTVSANASIEGKPFGGNAVTRPGTPVTVRLEPGTPQRAQRTSSGPPPLVVRVEDEAGRKVASATGRLRRATGTDGISIRAGTAFVVRSSREPGFLEVWGAADDLGRSLGLAPGRAQVAPADDEVLLRLFKGATIDGVVLGVDGTPARGVLVVAAEPKDAQSARRGDGAPPLSSARSAADGRFVLGGLPPDAELRLVVRPPSGSVAPLPTRVRSGDTGVTIALKASVAPWIRVVDADGKPVSSATVTVVTLRDDGTPWVGDGRGTDALGLVRWFDLDPAREYRLTAEAPGRSDLAALDVPSWHPRDETLRLLHASRVEGTVVDSDGKPVAGASVSGPPAKFGESRSTASTNAEGRFSLGPVRDGTVALRARAPLFAPKDVPVDVEPQAPPIVIALDRGREWRLRVDGWSPTGSPAYLSLTDEARPGDGPVSPILADDGLVVVSAVDASRSFTAWFAAGDQGVYVLARGLRPSDGETRLALSRGGTIRGRATLPAGAKDGWVTLRVGFGSASSTSVPIAADGQFELRAVPPGRFALEATATLDDARWQAKAEVSAGDSPTLVLAPVD